MGNLMGYLARLEAMAFFSAYPLLFFLVRFLAENPRIRNSPLREFDRLLPLSYALCGTLYAGLLARNLYPDFSISHISSEISLINLWGILAILFWIPLFNRRPWWSLIHSLVFFFFILKDLWQARRYPQTRDLVRNDMKIFTDSLLLGVAALLAIGLVAAIYLWARPKQRT